MQGGDFVYGSAGTQETQQPKSVDKRGKKTSFQLSKILPSPSKKNIDRPSNDQQESIEIPEIHENTRTSEVTKKNQAEHAEEEQVSEEDTSDADWYEYQILCFRKKH